MKEIHSLYLLAILGLLAIIALNLSLGTGQSIGNFGIISTPILFFIGLYGIAFTIRKEK